GNATEWYPECHGRVPGKRLGRDPGLHPNAFLSARLRRRSRPNSRSTTSRGVSCARIYVAVIVWHRHQFGANEQNRFGKPLETCQCQVHVLAVATDPAQIDAYAKGLSVPERSDHRSRNIQSMGRTFVLGDCELKGRSEAPAQYRVSG